MQGAGAAAIFQHHPSGNEPAASTANGFGSSLVSRGHRSSCEYVMSMSPASTTSTVLSSVSGLPSTPRRGGRTRLSIEAVDSRQSSKQFTLNGALPAGHVTAVVAGKVWRRTGACCYILLRRFVGSTRKIENWLETVGAINAHRLILRHLAIWSTD